MNKPIRSYGCTRCQKTHYEDEYLFKMHIDFQSKEGIELKRRPKKTKQTDLVEDYSFPDVPKNLRLGEK